MPWQQLLTDAVVPLLIAVVGGLVGGYVGFRGARSLQDRERRDKQMAAGRALFVEVQSNYNGTESLSKDLYGEVRDCWPDFTASHYYSRNVWQDTLPLVAPLLKWNELETLANAYRSFEIALKEIERAGHGISKDSSNDLWASFQNALQQIGNHALRTALHGFVNSVRLLAPKVLDKEEREKLQNY